MAARSSRRFVELGRKAERPAIGNAAALIPEISIKKNPEMGST